MTTVFFKINDVQEKEVKLFMQEEGYSNKAEFFRFLIKFYKYNKPSEEVRFEKLTDELKGLMAGASKNEKFKKPLEEQLNDV